MTGNDDASNMMAPELLTISEEQYQKAQAELKKLDNYGHHFKTPN